MRSAVARDTRTTARHATTVVVASVYRPHNARIIPGLFRLTDVAGFHGVYPPRTGLRRKECQDPASRPHVQHHLPLFCNDMRKRARGGEGWGGAKSKRAKRPLSAFVGEEKVCCFYRGAAAVLPRVVNGGVFFVRIRTHSRPRPPALQLLQRLRLAICVAYGVLLCFSGKISPSTIHSTPSRVH